MQHSSQAPARREFLRTLGGGALALTLAGRGWSAAAKPLRGVFPIGRTPVTENDKLDLECLQNEVKFCNRYKVHGFAWPQIASGWTTLSEKERMDGVEAILAAGKGGKTALVIGVQDKQGKIDLECLQNEVKFCNRYKVHGFAWPQIASGWTTLSEKERMDGVEAKIGRASYRERV